jgi:hypothetical protein
MRENTFPIAIKHLIPPQQLVPFSYSGGKLMSHQKMNCLTLKSGNEKRKTIEIGED